MKAVGNVLGFLVSVAILGVVGYGIWLLFFAPPNPTAFTDAASVGDVELGGKTFGELDRLLKQKGDRAGHYGTPTVSYVDTHIVTWFITSSAGEGYSNGLVTAYMTKNGDVMDNDSPQTIEIRGFGSFRGALLGIHLGDSCQSATNRLHVVVTEGPLDSPHAKWQELTDVRSIFCEENDRHQIVALRAPVSVETITRTP